MKELKARYGTREAINSIAKQLDLPNEAWMQDWAYEVADADRINQYIELYDQTTDEDEKFVLMQMIIQAVDDKKSNNELTDEDWTKVEQRLMENFQLHEYEIFYWSQLEKDDIENCFFITPEIRNIWIQKNEKMN